MVPLAHESGNSHRVWWRKFRLLNIHDLDGFELDPTVLPSVMPFGGVDRHGMKRYRKAGTVLFGMHGQDAVTSWRHGPL